CDVVHHRDALVEEVPAPGLEIATHSVAWNALPFQTRDELARYRVEIFQEMRERRARRFLHRQDLHMGRVDVQVGPMAFDWRIGDEVIEMRVVFEGASGRLVTHVVHEPPEESKGLGLLETNRSDAVRKLHLERCRLV